MATQVWFYIGFAVGGSGLIGTIYSASLVFND